MEMVEAIAKEERDSWQMTVERPGSVNRQLSSVNGLICLKGGDMALEISESGTRPQIVESMIFPGKNILKKSL